MTAPKKQPVHKFGDKVQIVHLSREQYRENILESYNELGTEYSDDLCLGDIGIVLKVSGNKTLVAFEEYEYGGGDEGNTEWVNNNEIALHSEESELTVLNRIVELQTKEFVCKEYKTLNERVVFEKDCIEVGCQEISKEDALKIAADIQTHFQAA